MSFLTITWDENQLLFLTARNQGKEIVFENAAYVSLKLPSDKSGEFRAVTAESLQKPIPENVSEAVLKFVQEHKLAKTDAVFVVSRSEVEVRPLSLPPIPNEELPDAIRFQAPKEFNRYDPNSPLDYFLLNEQTGNSDLSFHANGVKSGKNNHDGASKRRVLASIIRPDLVREISALCEKANLNLKRVVLHPCEETFLLRQTPSFSTEKTYLLVEIDPTEVLLTIIFRGQPVFMRSPRLFGDRAERMKITGLASQILSEIKRTLIAVQNEIQGITIHQIIMLGNSGDHQKLANDLSQALTVPVMQFDPWEGFKRGGKLKQSLPDSPELFAPLIGAMLLVGRNLPSDIDYINPKRRPPDNTKQQLFTTIALAVGLLLLLTVGFGYWRNHAAKKEFLQLSTRKAALQKEAEEMEQHQRLVNSIASWEANRFDWLAQLHWLSTTVPPPEDFMLTSLEIRVPSSGRGQFTIKGLARNAEVAAQVIDQTWDETHQPFRGSIDSRTSNNPGYPQTIDFTVDISHRGTAARSDAATVAALLQEIAEETEKAEETTGSETVTEEPSEEPVEQSVEEEPEEVLAEEPEI